MRQVIISHYHLCHSSIFFAFLKSKNASHVTEKLESAPGVWRLSWGRKIPAVLENESTHSDQSDSQIHQCCGINVVNTESHLVKEHGDTPVSRDVGKPRSNLWLCDFMYMHINLHQVVLADLSTEHEAETKTPDVHEEESFYVTVAGHSSNIAH